jgi:hypothetical protein
MIDILRLCRSRAPSSCPHWRSATNASSLACALLLGACGGDSKAAPPSSSAEREATLPTNTEPSETTSASNSGDPSRVSASGELDIIVTPGTDGSLPADLAVGCKSGPVFRVSDLETIIPLEAGDPGGVAEAIEPFLSSEEGNFWPQDGWQILRKTTDEVLLVHEEGDEMAFMTVERATDAWEWSGSQIGEGCPLYYVTPDGLNTVDWRLDPASPVDASNTTLAVLVTERECVSGQELGNRLRGPQIVMTDDTVRIAFAAEPPSGNQTCPGNPEASATVELPAPLGDREIVEGLAIVGLDLADFID